jgi:hypothetical protein
MGLSLKHAFVPGAAGSYLAVYCQHPAQPDTEPIPGYPSRNCGYPESVHTMTADQQADDDQRQADAAIEMILGGRKRPAPPPLNHGPQGKHGPNWDAEPGLDVIALLADRRQRAREAYWDSFGGPPVGVNTMSGAAIETAIETATRVRITPEIIKAARAGWLAASEERTSWTEEPGPRQYGRLKAAFRAAGFEVEE